MRMHKISNKYGMQRIQVIPQKQTYPYTTTAKSAQTGTAGTAMSTKVAVAFANIFMAEVETEILI